MTLDQHGWKRQGACNGADPELWFAPDGREAQAERERRERNAKAVCATCPVRETCLTYAFTERLRAGIWGGMTGEEREAERRRRQRRKGGAAA